MVDQAEPLARSRPHFWSSQYGARRIGGAHSMRPDFLSSAAPCTDTFFQEPEKSSLSPAKGLTAYVRNSKFNSTDCRKFKRAVNAAIKRAKKS